MGFTLHQNTLGSMMFISASLLFYLTINSYRKDKVISKTFLIYLSGTLFSLYLLFITFSRGAVGAFLIFSLICLFSIFDLKRSLTVIISLSIISAALYQFDAVKEFTNYLFYKNGEKIISSREEMYKTSYDAALRGGFLGIGYGMSDSDFVKDVPGSIKKGVFVREKGSSLMALMEETGIIGVLLFYLPIGIVVWKGVRMRYKEKRAKNEEGGAEMSFLISIIIAMTFHSQVEAWGVGVGSFMLPLYLFFQFRLWKLLTPRI